MAETEIIVDRTNNDYIIPFLLHFSKKGFVPKIFAPKIADFEILRMIKAEGPRLGELLKSEPDFSKLVKIYEEVGTRTGYMSKYYVSHGDSHPYNFVVENGMPVLIDWKKAQSFGNRDEFFWIREYARFLLPGTKEILEGRGAGEVFPLLEKAFSRKFQIEFNQRWDIAPIEVQMDFSEKYRI